MTTTALVKKPKPELLRVGSRALSSHGFRHDVLREHLADHLADKDEARRWCDVGCLTRTFEGRNTEKGRAAIRRRLPRAFKVFLDLGLFLTIDYAQQGNGHHGEALAVKLFDRSRASAQEARSAREQISRMRRRKLISEAGERKALEILGDGPETPTPTDLPGIAAAS
jgi:hypothetical protein